MPSFPVSTVAGGSCDAFDIAALVHKRHHCSPDEGRNRDPSLSEEYPFLVEEASAGSRVSGEALSPIEVVDGDNDDLVAQVPYSRGSAFIFLPSER